MRHPRLVFGCAALAALLLGVCARSAIMAHAYQLGGNTSGSVRTRPHVASANNCPIGPWHIVPNPNPGTLGNQLDGVAALSSSNVWAVGSAFASNTGLAQTLVEHWNGTAWTVVSSPNAGTGSNSLKGVAADAANDVWAVGQYFPTQSSNSQTLIEHWNGTAWSVVASPNAGASGAFNTLTAVVALSSTDVWAVGWFDDFPTAAEATLFEHWDGTQWSIVSSQQFDAELYGVAALSSTDVWAVGQAFGSGSAQTLVEHWDGKQWSVISSPNVGTLQDNYLYGVAATSDKDIWAVGTYASATTSGSPSLIEHWDGSSWSIIPSPNAGSSDAINQLMAVTAISPFDAWAVGNYSASSQTFLPLIEHWNGSTWSITSSPTISGSPIDELISVARVSANDVWAVGTYNTSGGTGPLSDSVTEHYRPLPLRAPGATQRNPLRSPGSAILCP